MNFLGWLQHWLAVHTGTVNESGPYYGFWSGFGSDIGEATLIAGVWVGLRKVNCHVKGCWRIGHHPHGHYLLCRKHHPEGGHFEPTAQGEGQAPPEGPNP